MTFCFDMDKEEIDFESIYNKYKYLLYKCSLAILKNSELAEEATKKAFFKIYKNLHKISNKNYNEILGLMITIVKGISTNILNKKELSLFKDIKVNIKDDIDIKIISTLQYKELILNIEKLKNELQVPFLLYYAYGYSDKEIAEILEISSNAVAIRRNRAKKILLKSVKERRMSSHEYQCPR